MNKITFDVVMNEWLNLKKLQVKPSTYVKYRQVLQIHIAPILGSYHIERVNEELIAQFFYLKKEDNCRSISISSMQTMRYLLKAILRYAETKYQISHIDLSYVKLPQTPISSRIITYEEEKKVAQYCFSHFNSISMSVLLGLYAGMRIGEICSLQWKDINLEEGIISINKTVQRIEDFQSTQHKTALFILEPKTQTSKRDIPLTQFLYEYVLNYQRHHPFSDEKTFVVSNNLKLLEPRTIQYQFQKLCLSLDIHLNFHGLRHTFATRCIEQKVDVKSLSEVLGHADVTTTLKRYVHSSLEFKKKQLNKIAMPDIS